MSSVFFANVTSGTLDLSVIGVIFLLALIYSIRYGRSALVALVLAFYPAILLFTLFPFIKTFTLVTDKGSGVVINNLVVFLIFLGASYVALKRVVGHDYSHGYKRYFESIILSVACTLLLMTVVYHVVPVEDLYNFSKGFDQIFAAKSSFFWFLLIPLGLILTQRKH